ncbi:MAG: BMP family ABC transporter substrate-binding protein [Spirochaetaceae bacterium]|jgi:basic membrane protein A|nr:BMP family ABC transporter substrate-binding protein [Spirochaetaceae bacterium]
MRSRAKVSILTVNKPALLLFTAVLYAGSLISCKGGAAKDTAGTGTTPRVILLAQYATEYQNGYIRGCFDGILQFYDESIENQRSRGLYYDVYGYIKEENTASAIQEASEEGDWDIIAIAGFTFSNALEQIAPLYPNQRYILIDTTGLVLPNAWQLVFAEEEGCYLVGAAAALKSIEDGIKNPVFGFIGGVSSDVISRFENGYINGVHSILPDAPVHIFYAQAWDKPGLAYTMAMDWFNNDTFIIFAAAGGTGKGMISAARECRQSGKNVWAIGVDIDQYDEGIYAPNLSAVYTSMIKRTDRILYEALDAIKNNSFWVSNNIILNLTNRGVGYTVTNSAMSAQIIERLSNIEIDIINGSITVEPYAKKEG